MIDRLLSLFPLAVNFNQINQNFQICQTTSIDALDSTSTEYSIVGQTSSISTSSNGAISSLGPSDKITTKIYGTITPAPKLQKRTSTISDSKNKVRFKAFR